MRSNRDWLRFVAERHKNPDFLKTFVLDKIKKLDATDKSPFFLSKACSGKSVIKPRPMLPHGDYDYEEK